MDLEKTGRLIIKKRKALALTQEELSEKLFVTPQAVSLWEKGRRFPDPAALVMIHKILDLNPVELLTGLEMYDDELKSGVSAHMNRINETVHVDGTYVDKDGFEQYIDFSNAIMFMGDGKGNMYDKSVSYADYYNIEKKERPKEDRPPRADYDPSKIYMNQGDCILTIPVELLEAIGSPMYFAIYWKEEEMILAISAEDELSENGFDIPEKVYSGKWKGIHVFGGDFGTMLLKKMGIKRRGELLEVVPMIYNEEQVITLHLDEVKRSGVELGYNDFLLPQWQHDQLWAEDEEDFEEEDE